MGGQIRKNVNKKDCRIAVDIGSTIVKVAEIGADDTLLGQTFHERDFDSGIAGQVESLLAPYELGHRSEEVLICSSANGGLRVGIVSLTELFSGAELRNQVLSAGANPVFLHPIDSQGEGKIVDVLLVGGGIDCEETGPLALRLKRFEPGQYRFGALMYAGNEHAAEIVLEKHPAAVIVENPLSDSLRGGQSTVFSALRSAYLDDLVYKEGISELQKILPVAVLPTPEVVNRGLHRAVTGHSSVRIGGPCVLLDLGGSTTDLNYTVEIVRDDSMDRPPTGSSVARYVFTDLGVVASRDSTLLQMQSHAGMFEFLSRAMDSEPRMIYQQIREGEYDGSSELLAYACVFLSLDRFAHGRGPGLPVADLGKISRIVLTGGAARALDEEVVARVVDSVARDGNINPEITIDRAYKIWVDGITWPETVAG